MKRLLRRIPGLVSAYRQVRILGWVLQDWCWSDAEKMATRSHLELEWDFETPEERQRHQRVLAAVGQHCGRAWLAVDLQRAIRRVVSELCRSFL